MNIGEYKHIKPLKDLSYLLFKKERRRERKIVKKKGVWGERWEGKMGIGGICAIRFSKDCKLTIRGHNYLSLGRWIYIISEKAQPYRDHRHC